MTSTEWLDMWITVLSPAGDGPVLVEIVQTPDGDVEVTEVLLGL